MDPRVILILPLIMAHTGAQSICNLEARSLSGEGLAVSSSQGQQYSSSDGCECEVRFQQSNISDNHAKVRAEVSFVIDGEDEQTGECPPFLFVDYVHDYYMCPKSMEHTPHVVDQGMLSTSSLYLYLHNPLNRRFYLNMRVTGSSKATIECRSSSDVLRQFIGSCPCSEKVAFISPTGRQTGDNYSIKKRLGIGFGAAALLVLLIAVLIVAYWLYKRREMAMEKEKAAEQGVSYGGSANPGYTGEKGGIYSEITPKGTPVKMTLDPDLNLNLAKTPEGYVPYRGSTDSGLYSSASVERPHISLVPEPGYASVDLQAPGHVYSSSLGGSRSSSQPQLAGFGAAMPAASPPQMSSAEVEALYAKPMKRRSRHNSGSRTPSRHASRDSLNHPASRHGSREMLGPSSRLGSREVLGPSSRSGSREMLDKTGVSEITVGYSYDPNPRTEDAQKPHNLTNQSNETNV